VAGESFGQAQFEEERSALRFSYNNLPNKQKKQGVSSWLIAEHHSDNPFVLPGTSGGEFSLITPEGGIPAYAIAGASESRRARGLLGTEERQAPLSRSNPVHAATSPAFALPADSVGVLPPANLQSHFTSGPGFTIWKQETPLGPKTERFSRLHVDTQHLGSTVHNDGGAGQCECTPAMSTLSNPQVSEEESFANLHVNQGTTCPEGIITWQCECSPAMSTSTGPGGPTSQCTSISQDEFQRPFPSVARSRSASPQSQLTQPALESQSSLTLMSRHVLDRSVSFAAWGAPASLEEQPDGWTPSDSHTPADSQTPSCSGEEGLPGERDVSRGGVAALLEEASQTFLSNCHEKRPASKPALDGNSSDEDASLWGDCADEFVESEEEGPALGVGMSFNSWASRSINLDGRAWGLGRQSQFAMDPSLLPEQRTTPTGQSGSEAQVLGSGSDRRASRGQQAFGSWDWRNGGPSFETSAADWSGKGDAPAELECREDELLCTEEGGDALDTEQEGAQSIDERLTAQHHDNTEWGGTGVLREQGRSPGTGLRSFGDCMQPVFASGNLEGALSLQDPGLERKGQGSEAKDTTGPALSSKSTGSIGVKRSSESDVERGGDDTSVFAEVEAPCVNRRTPENSPKKRTKAPELGISLDCWLPFKQLVGEAGAGGLKPGTLCGAGAAWGPVESEVESFSAMVDGTDGEGAMVEGDDRQGAIVSTSGAESGEFGGGHRMDAVQAVDRTRSGGFAGRPAATGVTTNLWGDPPSPSSPPAVNREQDSDESPSGQERVAPVEVPPSPSPKPRVAPGRENGARTGGPLSPGTKNRWAEGLRKAQGLIGQEGLQGVVAPRKPPRARLWSVKNGFKTLQYKTKEDTATGVVRERRGFGALRLQSSGVASQPPLLSSRVASGERDDEIRSQVRKLTPEEKAGRPGTGFALYSNNGRGARRSVLSSDCDAQSMDASQSSESIHRSSSPGGAASLGGSEPSTSSGSSFRIRSNARLVRNFSDARSSFQPNLCTIPGTPALPPMPEDSQVDSEGSKQSYSGAVVGAFGGGDAMDSPETPQVPVVQGDGGQECPEAPTGR
jgi:hypothetical protein